MPGPLEFASGAGPFFFVEGENASLQEDVGIGLADLSKRLSSFGDAARVLVRHREHIEAVRVLIASLDGLLEKANRFGPIRFRDRSDRDDVMDIGHAGIQ